MTYIYYSDVDKICILKFKRTDFFSCCSSPMLWLLCILSTSSLHSSLLLSSSPLFLSSSLVSTPHRLILKDKSHVFFAEMSFRIVCMCVC